MPIEVFALALIGAVALGSGITRAPLIDWDEATYAEVAHEAVSNGSYFDFTWNGDSYLKKPPALFWMMAASFKAFGESERSARLPSVVMGVATLILIYLSAAAVAGRLAGILAALIPLTFYFFVARGGRECATDAPLICFSTLSIYALGRARDGRGWTLLAGVAGGLAILSKGLAGVIPLLVAAVAIISFPGFSAVGLTGLALIVAAATIVAAPWFAYQLLQHGNQFWSVYVEKETLLRIASHLETHPRGPYETLKTFKHEVAYLWPLTLPLIGLCAASIRGGIVRSIRKLPSQVAVWLVWFALALGAACAVQTKLGWYILPALIPVALLAGVLLVGECARGSVNRFRAVLAFTALAVLAAEVPGRWSMIEHQFQLQRDRSRPSYIIGVEARELAALHDADELFFAGIPLPTLVYYSGLQCYFVRGPSPGFELTDLDGNLVSILHHEAVIRDSNGRLIAFANFDNEWQRSGPEGERVALPIPDADDANDAAP